LIDRGAILEDFDNDPQFLAEMLEIFIRDTRQRLAADGA
jgi:hypothetical protein